MSEPEPHPTPPLPTPPFQFRLRTLLLLCVVLGSSLAVFGGWGVVVFGLAVGLAVGIQQAKSLSSLSFLILAVFCLICLLVVLLMPLVIVPRVNSRRAACFYHLGNVVKTLLAYQDDNGHLPPAYITGENGKPMHSWRVLVLPYLENYALYKVYDFTEPWDGPKNKLLLGMRPPEYTCPSDPSGFASGATETSYVAVVGPNAVWAGEKPQQLADLGNEPSRTIMLIEVANSGVAWSEPRDFSVETLNVSDSKSPMALASHRVGHKEFLFICDGGTGVHVAMADGSVHFLRTDCLSGEDLRKVLAIGGCKDVAGGPHVVLDEEDWRFNWPNIAALAIWLLSVGTLLIGAVRSRKTLSAPPTPLAG